MMNSPIMECWLPFNAEKNQWDTVTEPQQDSDCLNKLVAGWEWRKCIVVPAEQPPPTVANETAPAAGDVPAKRTRNFADVIRKKLAANPELAAAALHDSLKENAELEAENARLREIVGNVVRYSRDCNDPTIALMTFCGIDEQAARDLCREFGVDPS